MKRYLFLTLLFTITCVSPSMGQDYKGSFSMDNTEFLERNDSLLVGFTIRIDSRTVESCGSMMFTPELRSEGQVFPLPYVQINGETRGKINRRWFTVCSQEWLALYDTPLMLVNVTKYTDEEMFYQVAIPYEQWMDKSSLYLRHEIVGCRGQVRLLSYKLSDRVAVAWREPYEVSPLVAFHTPADEAKTRRRQGSAFLDFQVGRSEILPDFRRNPVELAKINDALLEVMSESDAEITGLFIEGYASPEGRHASNEKLAYDRAMALKGYIKGRYMLDERLFTVRSVGEDWAGLRVQVEGSGMSQKEQLLAIIDSSDEPDRKEASLKRLSVYNQLLRDIFPSLRRVEYQVDYSVRNYNTAEARSLLNSNPENLSHAELYRVALEYDAHSPEYNRIIMETIPRYYEDDPVALSNAAALLIKNGELATALRYLEKAQAMPAAWNNLGVVYLVRGELDRAEELFRQAAAAGLSQAVHNQEELEKKRQDIAQQEKRNGR